MVETAASLFAERVARHPERVALRALAEGGALRPESVSWREWLRRSRSVAAALVTGGHQPGERVAILAGNRPLWPVADVGVLLAGGVSVGVYPTSAPGQVRQILADSGAVAVVVDTVEQLDKVLAVRAALPQLRTIVCQDATAARPDVTAWVDWLARGADALVRGAAAEVQRRTAATRPQDDALLIYTSGSTGEPKGARVSHRYLVASARSIAQLLGLTEADRSLSFLPFCHAAERVFGLYTRILCGMETGLVEDHTRVWESARVFGPTLFGGLPRFYEKVFESLRSMELTAVGEEAVRWQRVLDLGRRRSALRRAGSAVPPELEAEWSALGEPIFRRVREHFGGEVRLVTSGGAALPAQVAEYLDALGCTVLGAYGLTEHLCAAFNRPERYTFDSAGPPMPGTTLRIAGDGEILIRRGSLTFSGYHGRPEDTREAFTPDGEWLLTGDLGTLDEDGMLRITGRKKELMALSTGKKVAPLPIEAELTRDPWIGQAVLIGEGRKFVSALLTLRPPVVEAWARERGLTGCFAELVRHPEVQERVRAAVERVNQALSRPERVRRFVVLDRELSAEQGELTPTLKIRRSLVAERFRDRIDALYLLPEP